MFCSIMINICFSFLQFFIYFIIWKKVEVKLCYGLAFVGCSGVRFLGFLWRDCIVCCLFLLSLVLMLIYGSKVAILCEWFLYKHILSSIFCLFLSQDSLCCFRYCGSDDSRTQLFYYLLDYFSKGNTQACRPQRQSKIIFSFWIA